MKLPKSYIKKYGLTKLAWSKYKKSLRGRGKKNTPKVHSMAKKRKGSYRKKSKQKSWFEQPMARKVLQKVGYMAYGASRKPLNDAWDRFVSRTPKLQGIKAISISDEAVFLGGITVAKMMGGHKVPILKDFLRGGDAIEWANIGVEGWDMLFSNNNGESSGGEIF